MRTAAALDEGLRDVLIPETQEVMRHDIKMIPFLESYKLWQKVVFDENNGALVLISGKLDIQDSLKDEKYDVQTKTNIVCLQ